MKKVVYKYMPLREEFFDNRLLRFTPRLSLNGPFEVQPSFSQHAEFLHRVNGYGESAEEVIREMEEDQFWVLNGIAIERFDIYGILSLTERNDNLLMWAHYARNHTGMVIGLDSNHDFFDAGRSPKEHVRNAKNEYIGVLNKVKYSKRRSLKGDSLDEFFFINSNDWWTEREVRYVLPLAEADEIRRDGQSETLAFYQIPSDAILSVTFGLRTPKESTERIKSKIMKMECYDHVEMFQSRMSNEDYCLTIEPIG